MTSGRRKQRWRLLAAVALVVVVAVIGYLLLDKPNSISYYRVIDDYTLVAGSDSGPNANVRVTSVVETASTVSVTVSALDLTFGQTGEGATPYESIAKLSDPLGDRTVIDGSDGEVVRRATCPPPAYFATVCP